MGIQARADGARQAQPRSLHARDRRDDEAHRQEGQGIRPRHHPRRLRHAAARPAPTAAAWSRKTTAALPAPASPARASDACGFSFGKTPAGRTFEPAEVEQFLRDKKIGPLDGFRSKAGWPFTAEIVLKYNDEDEELEAGVRLWRRQKGRGTGELVDFGGQNPGRLPQVRRARARARQELCVRKIGAHAAQPTPSCDFKTGQVILQQPVDARADAPSCWPPARPTCWTSS
jgi:hypothetical protein